MITLNDLLNKIAQMCKGDIIDTAIMTEAVDYAVGYIASENLIPAGGEYAITVKAGTTCITLPSDMLGFPDKVYYQFAGEGNSIWYPLERISFCRAPTYREIEALPTAWSFNDGRIYFNYISNQDLRILIKYNSRPPQFKDGNADSGWCLPLSYMPLFIAVSLQYMAEFHPLLAGEQDIALLRSSAARELQRMVRLTARNATNRIEEQPYA